MKYNYRKFGLSVLTDGLNHFEYKQSNNITLEAMDKIWNIELTTSNNPRIKKIFGRYYNNAKR